MNPTPFRINNWTTTPFRISTHDSATDFLGTTESEWSATLDAADARLRAFDPLCTTVRDQVRPEHRLFRFSVIVREIDSDHRPVVEVYDNDEDDEGHRGVFQVPFDEPIVIATAEATWDEQIAAATAQLVAFAARYRTESLVAGLNLGAYRGMERATIKLYSITIFDDDGLILPDLFISIATDITIATGVDNITWFHRLDDIHRELRTINEYVEHPRDHIHENYNNIEWALMVRSVDLIGDIVYPVITATDSGIRQPMQPLQPSTLMQEVAGHVRANPADVPNVGQAA